MESDTKPSLLCKGTTESLLSKAQDDRDEAVMVTFGDSTRSQKSPEVLRLWA